MFTLQEYGVRALLFLHLIDALSDGVKDHPMVALDTVNSLLTLDPDKGVDISQVMDFTCVEAQIGDGSAADCEIVELDGTNGLPHVLLPFA